MDVMFLFFHNHTYKTYVTPSPRYANTFTTLAIGARQIGHRSLRARKLVAHARQQQMWPVLPCTMVASLGASMQMTHMRASSLASSPASASSAAWVYFFV